MAETAESPWNAEADKQTGAGAALSGGAPSLASIYGRRVLRVLTTNWYLLAAAAVLSGVLSWAAGRSLSTSVWQAEAVINYQRPVLPDDQKSIYNPLTPETYREDILSLENLDKLRQDYAPHLPARQLGDRFDLTNARNSQKVSIALSWSDGEEAAAMVNRLVGLFQDRAEARRDEIIKKTEQRLDASVAAAKVTLDAALKMLRARTSNRDLKTLTEDREQVRKSVQEREKDLAAKELVYSSNLAIQKSLQAKIAERRQEVAALEKEGKKKPDSPEKAIRLKEAEAKVAGILNEYDAERKKYDRMMSQGLAVTDEEKSRQLTTLGKLKLEGNLAKSTLEELKKTSAQDDTTLQNFLTEKAKVDVQLDGDKKGVDELARQIDALMLKLRGIDVLLDKAGVEVGRVQDAEKELQGLEKQQAVLRQLKGSDVKEVEVVQPAVPPEYATKTTKKQVMIVSFALPMLLILVVLVGFDLLMTPASGEEVASRLGLAVLGQVPLSKEPRNERAVQEETRALALRLRQFVPGNGSVLFFTPLVEGTQPDDLVAGLARFLAMRDESVLILDARIGQVRSGTVARLMEGPPMPLDPVEADVGKAQMTVFGSIPGLAQCLVFEKHDPSRHISRTKLPGVDCMPSGAPYPSTDILATQAMQDLLANLGQKYTLILLLGPPLSHGVDSEILAAYANGIVVLVNGTVPSLKGARGFAASLREARAPLLGSILC